ncbi:MAG: hypothetical protein NTY20_05640 [Candidatus Aenigmarchaeota archaeon]|nr:hypothetical protein [Candidatus Aenigmarchaeota archaeon]
MSKQNIVDVIAVVIVLVFLVIIYLVPPLKDEVLKVFCNPEIAKVATQAVCVNGLFIMYLIPFFSASWLILRVFVKITKFASVVSLDSRVCKGIGVIYQKIKILDG